MDKRIQTMIFIPFDAQFYFLQTILIFFLYIISFLSLKSGLKLIPIFFLSHAELGPVNMFNPNRQ
jgi:predicted CDP-diglyceride synthetase/phosphatidate cytidylyltransferase